MRAKGEHAPSFERTRAFYIGLNKVADGIVAGEDTILNRSYQATAKTKAHGSVTSIGVVGGVTVSGEVESGVKSSMVSDETQRSQLLAIAPSVFERMTANSVPAETGTKFELGHDYHLSGTVRFAIRTHDDFREESELEDAPRLGLWLMEIPDDLPASEARSVTWVLLSGMAKGQIKTELGGSISDWRGGSQTEHLFELLATKMDGAKRRDTDERWLRDPYYALAARNLLSRSREQEVEVAFMCLDVHDCPTSGEDLEVSYLDWSPASTDREVVVSRVVLGTPYFVQFSQAHPHWSGEEDRSLWQRFRDFFGL